MKIEIHIEALLYRYQCVTIPGFGAFLTEIQSAQWNKNSNAFFPPKKGISFNTNLKNNDGLLANHIAKSENISYEKAIVIIENEVLDLFQNLQSNGKVSIKNIGELTLNSEKNIVFVAFDQPNYLMESFGLSSFIAPSIKREIEFISEEKPVVTIATPSIPEVFKIEERYANPYLKYAVVAAITLFVMGSIGFKIQQDRVETQTLLVQNEVQKEVQNKIQEATFFIDTPLPSVTLALKDEKMPYHIVAGAFRVEENAERICQELKTKGFKAKKIRVNHGLFPVIYGSYSSFAEAQNAMKTIQETENPEAWLLTEDL